MSFGIFIKQRDDIAKCTAYVRSMPAKPTTAKATTAKKDAYDGLSVGDDVTGTEDSPYDTVNDEFEGEIISLEEPGFARVMCDYSEKVFKVKTKYLERY